MDGWVTLDRQTEIHQVDDRPIDTRYFTIRGPGSAEVAGHIRQDCELWSTSEALAELSASTTPEAIVAAVYAAALSATDKDGNDVARALCAFANHSDAGVRMSLVIATGYFPHPDLVALVRGLSATDPAPDLRADAGLLLAGLRQAT